MRTARAAAVLFGLAFLLVGAQAEAACHAFGFFPRTAAGSEGVTFEVKVHRDAAVRDSSVRVSTVAGTAKAPGDYKAFDQRVTFTGEETEKTIKIQTVDDKTREPDEKFTLKLSEGQGCEVNQNFQYGDPLEMTIAESDLPAPTTPAPTAASTPISTVASSPSASPSPSPTASAEATDTPSPSPSATAFATDVEEDDDGFPWLPVIAVLGFAGAAAGALILTRMRGAGTSPV